MTTLLNDVIDRTEELHFAKKHAPAAMNQMMVHNLVWLVNDITGLYSFVRLDSDAKLLKQMRLWPK